MNIKTPQITESVSKLKNLIRKSSIGYQKQRLTILYLYRSGQAKTRKQAAQMIGVHRKTVGEWLATYASGGLDALLERADEFSKIYASSLNVLVLDNGRFHPCKSLQIPDNIVFVFLPPYSPELNPIERLWQDIKAKLFDNVFTSIEEMQNKLSNILRKYTETKIASITNAEYLTKVANGI